MPFGLVNDTNESKSVLTLLVSFFLEHRGDYELTHSRWGFGVRMTQKTEGNRNHRTIGSETGVCVWCSITWEN